MVCASRSATQQDWAHVADYRDGGLLLDVCAASSVCVPCSHGDGSVDLWCDAAAAVAAAGGALPDAGRPCGGGAANAGGSCALSLRARVGRLSAWERLAANGGRTAVEPFHA